MKYTDRVWGETEINEPVILELLNCSCLNRLKGIDQAGYPKPFFQASFNRFEHSLGVYLLLRKFDARLEEQIAGLIHDVSHGAFSHCLDYALEEGSPLLHNHQDNIFKKFVLKSDIPAVLKKYGIDIDYILDEKNFPLKERDIPELCADRIDYSFRTALSEKVINITASLKIINNLKTINNQWVFESKNSAQDFADLFLKLNRNYYASFTSACMFATVGECLKYALDQKYITYEDLYTTDLQVINKIKKFINIDYKLSILWDRMNGKVKITNNPDNYDRRIVGKSRIVDPLFPENGKIIRLSEKNIKWKKIVAEELRPKEYFLKFEEKKIVRAGEKGRIRSIAKFKFTFLPPEPEIRLSV